MNNFSSSIRNSMGIPIVAITGSAGKTSVKELLGFCLNKLDKTYFSKNSFNNKYGVPLSLFNTPPKTKPNTKTNTEKKKQKNKKKRHIPQLT